MLQNREKIIFLSFVFLMVSVYSYEFTFERLSMCENIDTPIKAYFTIQNRKNSTKVSVKFNLTLPDDVGDNHHVKGRISALVLNKWIKITDISDKNSKNPCVFFMKFFGETIYDIQRRVGMVPGACPIRKGFYTCNNCIFDYSKTPIRFPTGKAKIDLTITKGGKTHLCWIAIFNSKN